MRFRVLYPALALLLVAGCGKPADHIKDAGAEALPDQWQLAKNDEYDVAIGIAPGWKDVRQPPDAPSVDVNAPQEAPSALPPAGNDQQQAASNAVLNDLKDFSSKMQQESAKELQAEMDKEGILLWIVGGARPIPGEEPTEYTLKHKKLGGEMDIENAANVAKGDLILAHDPEYVTTPLGKSAKFVLNYTDKAGDHVHKVMYAFVDGATLYELTFSNTGDFNQIKDIEGPAMQTLRIRPGLKFPEAK